MTFLILPFQVNAMFGRGEKKKITSSEAPAEITEQQRRATDAANGDADLDEENDSSQAARGTTFHVSEIEGTNQQEGGEKEEEKIILSLENFRAAATNPDFAGIERLIIDPESGLIRPHNEGTDSKSKGKNEAIIAALKTALQIDFPMFSSTLVDEIFGEELPPQNMLEKLQEKPALSTETLQRILARADNAMAELTSVVLAMVNVPFVSLKGIADAVSTFATFADQRLTMAEAQRAYKTLQSPIQKAEAATEGHEQVDEAANKMQTHAEERERLKRQEDHDETLRLSTLVGLPNNADDLALHQWATELACESDATNKEQATTTAHLLYKQAKKNPAQIHELVSKLWGERVTLLQQEAQRLEEETSFEAQYQSAQKKEIKAEAEAMDARSRLEAAAQQQSEWLRRRDQLRNEKKTLEDQLRTDAEHREDRQCELEAKRRELGLHQTQKEAIDSTYQAATAAAVSEVLCLGSISSGDFFTTS